MPPNRRGRTRPSQKIEWLVGAEIATVMQAPGDGRQVLQPNLDMSRLRFEYSATVVLGERPPRRILANGYERRACCTLSTQAFLLVDESHLLIPIDIALVAGNPAQKLGSSIGWRHH